MEMILFTGIQGSGKSEYFKRNFYDTHIRINLDMLKTRHRENLLIQACLEARQPFVVDNTNPLAETRQNYIRLARQYGFTVTGYYFSAALDGCLARNNGRGGKACVPVPAILGTYKKLEIPSPDEGFDHLYYVTIDENNQFITEVFHDDL